MTDRSPVTIRLARPDEGPAVRRLALLDSSDVPTAPVLVALADGAPAAALSLADGHAVADPFEPTGPVVALLRERATALRGPSFGHARRAPRLRRPRLAI